MSRSAGLRITQLDGLRGIAALLVFALHVGQFYARDIAPSPAIDSFNAWIDLGRAGVVTFFLISGFVMPSSFSRSGLRVGAVFVRRRFFRLFPAFWASLIAAIALASWHGGRIDAAAVTTASALANATMAPSLFGHREIVSVYWTLEVELMFYTLLLAIYVRRPLSTSVACGFAFGFMALAFAYAALGRRLGMTDLPPLSDRTFQHAMHLSMMFAGAALRLHWDTRADRRAIFASAPRLLKLYAATWAVLLIAAAAAQMLREGFGASALRTTATYGFAIALFLGVLRFGSGGRVGAYLGARSYSLYLFHILALTALTMIAHATQTPLLQNFWIFATCGLIASLAVAHLAHAAIEAPFMAIGRRAERAARPNLSPAMP